MLRQKEILTAAVMWVVACSDPVGIERELGAPIQTDRLRYEMKRVARGYETEIEYTFTNPTSQTVYVVNCHGASEIVMERWEGGSWRVAYGPNIPDCLSPAIEIPASASWTTTMYVFGGDPDCGCTPQFADGIEGTYRLNWRAVLLLRRVPVWSPDSRRATRVQPVCAGTRVA